MESKNKYPKYFNYKIVKNQNYEPFLRKDFKKINNTSLIIIWRNRKTKELKYLIQKRSNKMRHGKNKLAVGGGMLEKSDKTLQFGAIREVIEESQVQFKKKKNLTVKTIKQLEPYLFPLKRDGNNFTFFLIISSFKEPKFFGPIKHGKIKPFLDSSREVDLEDKTWDDKKLKGKIKYGHAFLSKKEILRHYDKKAKIWKYTKRTFDYLFEILG